MDILKRAREHYKNLRQEGDELLVPEWADEQGNPAKLIIKPLPLAIEGEIQYLAINREYSESCLKRVIHSCFDEKGEPIFSIKEYEILKNQVSGKMLFQIANQINKMQDAMDDRTIKKSESVETST